jgi:SAM-dependent methyltransferase
MTDIEYFEYLKTISPLGRVYRRFFVYPQIAESSSGKILDIGCGIGGLLAYKPDIIGVDINKYCVEYCNQIGLQAHVMLPDILPFGTGSFDTVILDNVLEHIAAPEVLVREIRRVLVPDGLMIILVPGIKGYSKDDDHKKYYDFTELTTFASDNEFTVLTKKSLPFPGLSKIFSGFCYFVVMRNG